MHKDLLTFKDWSPTEMRQLLAQAMLVKNNPQDFKQELVDQSIVGFFEKPSLRTRVSFDIGINKLGGHLVYLDSQAGKLAGREDAKDMGANLACWADAIVARVFSHETLEQLAEASNVPVINALCDTYHPCQALADYLTLHEVFGDATQTSMAYVGDGNNVTHSLMIVAALLGAKIIVVTPPGHEVDLSILEHCQTIAAQTGANVSASHQLDAAKGVQVVYTDTWISMGDNTPLEQIKQAFEGFQVNSAMLERLGAQYVMHCQPAHRDLEISSELIDSNKSLLMQQAENRMHAQNAILVHLLGDSEFLE